MPVVTSPSPTVVFQPSITVAAPTSPPAPPSQPQGGPTTADVHARTVLRPSLLRATNARVIKPSIMLYRDCAAFVHHYYVPLIHAKVINVDHIILS